MCTNIKQNNMWNLLQFRWTYGQLNINSIPERRRRAYRLDIIRLVDVRGLVTFRNIEPNSNMYMCVYTHTHTHGTSIVLYDCITFYRYIYSKNIVVQIQRLPCQSRIFSAVQYSVAIIACWSTTQSSTTHRASLCGAKKSH